MKPVNELKMELFSKSVNESFARYAIGAFAAQLDPGLGELSDIRTAVSEAVTNCIVHAYGDGGGVIYITVSVFENRKIKIKIKDRGCGIADIETAKKPLFTTDTTGERGGMGFAIMEIFTDKLSVRSKPGVGTTVVMTKQLST